MKAFVILALVAQLTLPVLAANQLGEQTVTPITPSQEQRVEPLSPGTEQRVDMVNAEGVQGVEQGTDNPVQRGVGAVSKVVVGVVAFAVSIGVTVATLLFI